MFLWGTCILFHACELRKQPFQCFYQAQSFCSTFVRRTSILFYASCGAQASCSTLCGAQAFGSTLSFSHTFPWGAGPCRPCATTLHVSPAAEGGAQYPLLSPELKSGQGEKVGWLRTCGTADQPSHHAAGGFLSHRRDLAGHRQDVNPFRGWGEEKHSMTPSPVGVSGAGDAAAPHSPRIPPRTLLHCSIQDFRALEAFEQFWILGRGSACEGVVWATAPLSESPR